VPPLVGIQKNVKEVEGDSGEGKGRRHKSLLKGTTPEDWKRQGTAPFPISETGKKEGNGRQRWKGGGNTLTRS